MHSLAANTKQRQTMKQDLSNVLAAEMYKFLNSDENKKMFSTSSTIEKLAFKKVSEEDVVTEVEKEVAASLNKKASATEEPKAERNLVKESVDSLLKISEDLDTAGFDKLAAASILLADKLFVEAKKAKKSKSKSKSDKSNGKKVDMKERMKKMREMKDGKKNDKKSSKPESKSDKGSKKSEAQAHNGLQPQKLEPKDTEKQEGDLILSSLHPNVRAAVVALEVHPSEKPGVHNVLVRVQNGKEAAINVIKNTVSSLQNANKLPAKTYIVQQA